MDTTEETTETMDDSSGNKDLKLKNKVGEGAKKVRLKVSKSFKDARTKLHHNLETASIPDDGELWAKLLLLSLFYFIILSDCIADLEQTLGYQAACAEVNFEFNVTTDRTQSFIGLGSATIAFAGFIVLFLVVGYFRRIPSRYLRLAVQSGWLIVGVLEFIRQVFSVLISDMVAAASSQCACFTPVFGSAGDAFFFFVAFVFEYFAVFQIPRLRIGDDESRRGSVVQGIVEGAQDV